MATNIFYRIPSQKGTRVATITGSECTLNQFCDYIINSEGLKLDNFIVAHGTKVFRSHSCSLQNVSLRNNSHVDILIPLLGGKGGFGSLLRAIGAQIEKTTNKDACRDLSGRRLRDIKREDELKKLVALQEKLQEERQKRKKEKLEKLKKKTEETTSQSKSIQELVAMFDDHDYSKRRHELSDILEAAVEKGLININKRKQEDESERDKRSRLARCSTEENSSTLLEPPDPIRTKQVEVVNKTYTGKAKKSDLWLGLDDTDDESNQSQEDECCDQRKSNQVILNKS